MGDGRRRVLLIHYMSVARSTDGEVARCFVLLALAGSSLQETGRDADQRSHPPPAEKMRRPCSLTQLQLLHASGDRRPPPAIPGAVLALELSLARRTVSIHESTLIIN
jgi:hypothetical protein